MAVLSQWRAPSAHAARPATFPMALSVSENAPGPGSIIQTTAIKAKPIFFYLKKEILFDIRVARGLRLKGPFLPGRIHTQFTFYQQIHFDSSRKEKFLEFNLL